MTLYPILESMIGDRHIAFRQPGERRLRRSPWPLLERPQDRAEVVGVCNEILGRQRQDHGDPRARRPHQIQQQAIPRTLLRRQQRQHLGLVQVGRHGVDSLEHEWPFGAQARRSQSIATDWIGNVFTGGSFG